MPCSQRGPGAKPIKGFGGNSAYLDNLKSHLLKVSSKKFFFLGRWSKTQNGDQNRISESNLSQLGLQNFTLFERVKKTINKFAIVVLILYLYRSTNCIDHQLFHFQLNSVRRLDVAEKAAGTGVVLGPGSRSFSRRFSFSECHRFFVIICNFVV